ncbi:MAG: alpha/beta fold hydrolase, partial [Bacteroidota bacterium]|nr:alpha/beta fold hydrolase [Bacteroidota bacterium]
MPTQRRNFIKVMAALSVAATFNPLQTSAFMVNDIDEKEQFIQAQAKLLKKYKVSAQSKFVKLDKPSLTLHVLEAGKGEPVLMLHGGGSVACQFAPLMGTLQNDFHLFVPDRPGCGLSDMINYNDVSSFRQHVVDCVTQLLDNLKLDKVALIGNSMGGYWSLLFSLAHPERVSKIVLIGEPAASSPYGSGPFAPPADKNPSLESITKLYQF